MRIMHTSDWHIGKKLNGKTRLDEQREVLGEIAAICERESIDLVLVAGDVYDTYTPSAEAEELFFESIEKIASEKRAVVVISGNHDDLQRLCAASALASRANAYVFGGEKAPECVDGADRSVYAENVGKRHCVIRKGDERVYVGVLPYPTEKRFGETKDDGSFDDKMRRWIAECFEENTEKLPQILLSHVYMLGGIGTDGERQIDLGGTRAVDRKLIPDDCLYTALGHLHKRQIIDSERHIIYSGAILEYGFDEANVEKSVTVFELTSGKVGDLKTVPLEKGRRLSRLTALGAEAAEKLIEENAGRWIEMTLYLDSPLSESETRRLVSMKDLAELRINRTDPTAVEIRADRRKMDEKTAFIEYYKSCYSCEPPEELLAAYLSLMNRS